MPWVFFFLFFSSFWWGGGVLDFEILLPIGYPFVISITMRASCLILSCPCNFFSFFGGRTLLFLGSSVFGFEARGDLLFRCLFFFVFLISRPCVSYLANSRGLAGLMRRNDGNEPSRCFFSCACVFCAIHTFAVLLVFIFFFFSFIFSFFFRLENVMALAWHWAARESLCRG